jgi:hypothetical protein
MLNRTLFAVVFLVGCATGGVASQFVVPPAKASASATSWEYFCADTDANDMADVSGKLNEAGKQGWELVTMNASNGFYCFKRAQ